MLPYNSHNFLFIIIVGINSQSIQVFVTPILDLAKLLVVLSLEIKFRYTKIFSIKKIYYTLLEK